MKKITLLIIPEGTGSTRQLVLPKILIQLAVVMALISSAVFGFLAMDYWSLIQIRKGYDKLSSENANLKGEAKRLMASLETVKDSLSRVKDYSQKLGDITSLQLKQVSKKTGIGPLNDQEVKLAKEITDNTQPQTVQLLPAGVNPEALVFRPVFDNLIHLEYDANQQALELQSLLSTVSQQRSILMSVPSVTPVNGWITSGFGKRISPFTGESTMHQGLDLASPVGTPIFAPADGVVIFSGAKEGFGNFVMIAHGYGIVTRYGHNAENLVSIGQRVARGEQIATVGMTGQTTGPHLHYEIMHNGHYVNPQKFILNGLNSAQDSLTMMH